MNPYINFDCLTKSETWIMSNVIILLSYNFNNRNTCNKCETSMSIPSIMDDDIISPNHFDLIFGTV